MRMLIHCRLQAGARLTHDLTPATLILGIKEIPIVDLPSPGAGTGRTYAFFSHTHKGQIYNRPLLDTVVKSHVRLVDWELLTDNDGRRVVAFGWMAGAVSLADGLSALGLRALTLGIPSPFLVCFFFPFNSLPCLDQKFDLAGNDSIYRDRTPISTLIISSAPFALSATLLRKKERRLSWDQ
jgi:hypothetical protein